MLKKLWEDFEAFIAKGNALDLAVGIIIGTAFKGVVDSLVRDVLTPPLGLLLGRVNFDNLYVNLSREEYASLAEAQEAGAPVITYGAFFNTVISFLITAIAIFLIVELANWVREQPERWRQRTEPLEEPEPPTVKKCPFCLTEIPISAVRCPNCTSRLEETPQG